MYSDRNLINRRNVKADVHEAYTQGRDFFMLEFEARVVAAALKILGMPSIDSAPVTIKIPHSVEASQGYSILGAIYLFKVAKAIMDTFVCANSKASEIIKSVLNEEETQQINAQQQVTADGRYKCRSPGCSSTFKHDGKRRLSHEQKHDPPPVIPEIIFSDNSDMPSPEPSKKDDSYNYNCCLISYGLLFIEFLDCIAEGDGDRNLRCWKMFLLHFHNDSGSTKYALEALYYTLQVHSLLTPRQAYRLMWNRSVKGRSSNVPLDLDLEHDNKVLKEQVRKLGRNLTEKAVSRICKFQFVGSKMLDNYDKCIKMMKKTGKHTVKSDSKDFMTILNKLVVENVMEFTNGRSSLSFPCISSDPLDKIDIHALYLWINDHKKYISLDKKAR
jgi:DNA-binding TFAR19-related protein (PDSD5 family)